jgi:hypothetical protein
MDGERGLRSGDENGSKDKKDDGDPGLGADAQKEDQTLSDPKGAAATLALTGVDELTSLCSCLSEKKTIL